MSIQQVVVGAECKAYINGRFWANIRNFRFQIISAHREQYGLDSLLPFELVPTRYSVNGSMQMYRLRGDGGLEGRGVMAASQDVPREKYVTFHLESRATGEILFRTDFAKFHTQQWDVGAKRVVSGNSLFTAIDCRTGLIAGS